MSGKGGGFNPRPPPPPVRHHPPRPRTARYPLPAHLGPAEEGRAPAGGEREEGGSPPPPPKIRRRRRDDPLPVPPQRGFCPPLPPSPGPAHRALPSPPPPPPPPSAHTKSRRGRLSPGVCAPRWRRAPPIPTLTGRGPCGVAAPPAVRGPGGRGGKDDGGLGRAGGGCARRVPPSLGSAQRGAALPACLPPPARSPSPPAGVCSAQPGAHPVSIEPRSQTH